MFDSDSDHTVPTSGVMVYRPSFYPLKESRERRMKTQYMSPNAILPYDTTKLEGYCVPHQLSCNMSSCGYENNTDNFSGYNIPLEPETPEDDVCVEEILVGLGDASDGWYRPNYERILSLPPRKRFSDMRVPCQDDDISPPLSPFQGKISQIVQQDGVNMMMKKRRLSPPMSPEDEPRLVESGDEKEHSSRYVLYGFDDELELEPKRKIKKARLIKKELAVPVANAVEVSSTNDEEGGVCGKTNKPRQRKEYFYSKNSKTIFRWTCCGSQAKDHPDF